MRLGETFMTFLKNVFTAVISYLEPHNKWSEAMANISEGFLFLAV